MNVETPVPATADEFRTQLDELSGKLAAATGKPRYKAEAVVARVVHDLIDDAARHQRVRPEAEHRAIARLKREAASSRRGRWRNHPGRRRH